jgi:hypothetical protein
MTGNTATGRILGKTADSMKDIGKTENNMEKDFIDTRMDKSVVVVGKKEDVLSGSTELAARRNHWLEQIIQI